MTDVNANADDTVGSGSAGAAQEQAVPVDEADSGGEAGDEVAVFEEARQDGGEKVAAAASAAPIDPINYKISDKLVVATDPSSPQAEAVAAIRTHLLSHHFGRGRRGIALCSPSAKSGTTFVAVNLAVSLARTGMKTLLIDANLRDPAVHTMIVPSREMPSLKSVLVDPEGDFGAIIQEEVMPNLSLIYSGGKSVYAQELLSGSRFKSLIDLCQREFDVTIVDTPAGNTNADGRRIAAVVRHAIILARKDWTYVSDIRTLINELQSVSVNVVGTIYNEF